MVVARTRLIASWILASCRGCLPDVADQVNDVVRPVADDLDDALEVVLESPFLQSEMDQNSSHHRNPGEGGSSPPLVLGYAFAKLALDDLVEHDARDRAVDDEHRVAG